MRDKIIYLAMSPIIRITKDVPLLGRPGHKLRKGDLCELIDGDDDYYAVADDCNGKPYWISMCGVRCEPANRAALDFYAMIGWAVSPAEEKRARNFGK